LDYHEVENNHPFAFKTHDFGKTWTSISAGLPADDPARVIRENPNKKGMLALGTDAGLFYSYDEGDHWTALKGNFPTVPIYDIQFHKQSRDLVVATHGRGLFVLDDITPLEETTPQVLAQDFHLYSSQPGVKWRSWGGEKHGFSAHGDFSAPNPPTGVVISYYLAKSLEPAGEHESGASAGQAETSQQQQPRQAQPGTPPQGSEAVRAQEAGPEREEPPVEGAEGRERRGPVKIVITDPSGQVVRTLYGPGKQGINRVTWNMRYDAEKRLNSARRGDEEENEFFNPGGPAALPGKYKVGVTAAGKTENVEVAVEPDPRMPFDMEAGRAQLREALELRSWLNAVNESINRIDSMKAQITTVLRLLGPDAENTGIESVSYQPVATQARALQRKLNTVEDKIFNVAGVNDPVARLHNLARAHDRLQSAYRAVSQPYNQAPTAVVMEDVNAVKKEVDAYLAEFNELLRTDVAAFNKLALEKGANTLFAGNPIELKTTSTATAGGQ